ncbi:putative membrane protein [Clostridium sp. CAG:269]|nr:putative membrane protein [Clostridium sp. CAG:269]
MKILIGALFLSLWQSLLFWKQDLGISVLLFTIPIIWITTKLLKGNIKNKKALLISIPIIILSSTYFIFDNLTFYLINIVLIPILYLIMIIWAISDFQIKSIMYKIILMIFQPLNYIGDVIKTVINGFNSKRKNDQIEEKTEKNDIFKAICLTGIIALIVISLLCSADNEFAKIFSTIFKDINIFNVSELTGRIIIIIIAFFYFAGFFMNMLDKENGLKEFEKDEKAEKKESYTIRMMITVLNLVYLVFCFTQIKVLFTEQNIKYSEFARKGFFQLMIVSLINIVMILKANNKNLRENEKQEKYKKTMCIVMVIFTLIIIISAFARMTLYQQNYGYTRLRILVDYTLITEIILLIPTIIYILKNKIDLIKTYFVIIITMYCLVNFINIDKIIMKNNFNRYKETGYIDLNYLMEMNNSDLIEQLLELKDTEFKYSEKAYSQSDTDKQEIQEQIGKQQRELNGYLASWKKSFNETHTLAEFNLPKMRAKSILNNRK